MNPNQIKIENHNPYSISFRTNIKEYYLAASNEGIPTVEYVTLEELKFINSTSKDIRTGNLMIDSEDKDEVFEALHIVDRGEFFTNEEIRNIILKPTAEGMKKIIYNTDPFTFERIYAQYVYLKNNGEYDVSNRIASIIEKRNDEFSRRVFTTKIVINDAGFKRKESIEEVKKQNDDLVATIEEMKKKIELLTAESNSKRTRKKHEKPEVVPEEKESDNETEVDMEE